MSNTPTRPCTTTALLRQNSLSWISTPSATCLSMGLLPLVVGSRSLPSTSGLLIHEGLGAVLSGDRVHVAEFEDISVGIGELTLVHEAVVRGGMGLRATRGDAVGQHRVDRLPVVKEDGSRRRHGLRRVGDRPVGKALKVIAHQDHEVAVAVLDDDPGGIVILEVDGES